MTAASRTIYRGSPEAPAYAGAVSLTAAVAAAVAAAKVSPPPPQATTLQSAFSGTPN